jgi:hypothetical protein
MNRLRRNVQVLIQNALPMLCRLLQHNRLIVLDLETVGDVVIKSWVADLTDEQEAQAQRLCQMEIELDKPLTNRGFLLGCALIAEGIDWAKFKEGIDEVEGLTTTFQRLCKVFREYETKH